MRDILALPQDILAVIWSSLHLPDILRLRQTCSDLSEVLSNDKQLWIQIFDKNVKARSLPVPYNSRSVEHLDTHEIESLVKRAVVLERNCANPGKLSFQKIGNRLGLGVTWLKLLRGRWCLIASSNTEQSEFSVWEIPLEGDVYLAERVYLEGPVIDGLVDETAEHLHCALTVGTSQPYILIFAICSSHKNVAIRLLKELRGASHVRFLDRRYVGFAVRNGDDTYPYIAEWKGEEYHKLLRPNTNPLCPLPIESCIAMTITKGHVLALNPEGIDLFAVSGSGNQLSTRHVAFLALQERAHTGYLFDISNDEVRSDRSDMFIRLYYQDFLTHIRQAVVSCHTNPGYTWMWTLEEIRNNNPPDVFREPVMTRHCLGNSGRRIFCITSQVRRAWLLPNLSVGAIRSNHSDQHIFTSFEGYQPIPKDGFPLFHLITSLAFDDGNGLLLVGTISGDVRIASFVEEEFVSRNGTLTDLPDVGIDTPKIESKKISESLIRPDLPTFYDARKRIESLNNLPYDLLQQVIQSWRDPLLRPLPFSAWSNDWSRFEYVSDWIFPHPRWGAAERHYYEAPTTTARVRLQSLGEIIPVMYNTQNHRRVVFRIGQRVFYCRTRKDDLDEEEAEDFDDELDIILGVLPCMYDHLFSAPLSVMNHVLDYDIQRNLTELCIDRSYEAQSSAAAAVVTIRDYQRSQDMEVVDDASMEQWTSEEWNRRYRESN